MSLHQGLIERESPVQVGLIGTGAFGSMFLAQARRTEGIEIAAVADLDPARAAATLAKLGWEADELEVGSVSVGSGRTGVVADAAELIAAAGIEVVIEATGDAGAGLRHAEAAIEAGCHVVMVNVEADVLAGPLLARQAAERGVVYSMAYGDQPAIICELVDWARASGFEVVAAGKGTRHLPAYSSSTPETVWDHYGLSAAEAEAAGFNPKLFNSFLDGTKSAIEMAALADATGLHPAATGLRFPPAGTSELAEVLRPEADGGSLGHAGTVEVVSSLRRDGTEIADHLRWGVYVVIRAADDFVAERFAAYGVATDSSGTYAALHRPFHFIGLELGISVASIAVRGEPTGSTRAFVGDAVAVAKRDLAAGETLDGEGGFTVFARLAPAADSLAAEALPIGLAHGVKLVEPVAAGETVRWSDVTIDEAAGAAATRRRFERAFGPSP